jgi:hypothetical protein
MTIVTGESPVATSPNPDRDMTHVWLGRSRAAALRRYRNARDDLLGLGAVFGADGAVHFPDKQEAGKRS